MVACWLALIPVMGASFTDDFSSAPTRWRTHNPGAVVWNEAAKNLAVTWDSRQTNSFFYLPLGTTLTRGDSFTFEFTIRIDDLQAGIDSTKQETFSLGLGFLNLAQAKRPEFNRGAGVNALRGPRSLVEFAYFPEAGLVDATVGPIIASASNQIAFSHTHPVELTVGETYRVRVAFDAGTQVLATSILHNGQPYGLPPQNTIQPLNYPTNYADFRLDAFSIHSYSDAGQFPPQYAGSLLAHGVIDDVALTWPDPPEVRISGHWDGAQWVVNFATAAGWTYSLERSVDLANWSGVASGAGAELRDPNPPSDGAFYRVLATRL
jgi:hypothetical protein